MARFWRWLDKKPDLDFSNSPPLHKLVRVILMAVALIAVMAPVYWLFMR